ncbi:hypothetical protein BHE74_00042190 [Ensete ventricosum]|nr:hypothetical protein GW17_00025281 [Ensete ventricosum]RWW51458.1 hypothetical protein BHE74_00042190 [Ensete ventricosum]RZR93472.1 hypothetical protein BHM03_00021985 [Ensete ventricosum]
MKVGVFAAFLVAASSVALAAASPEPRASSSSSKELVERGQHWIGIEKGRGRQDKFAPRFDGLRFINTLVMAHR